MKSITVEAPSSGLQLQTEDRGPTPKCASENWSFIHPPFTFTAMTLYGYASLMCDD